MTDPRIQSAMHDVARLRAGWRPGEADLGANVAFIEGWMLAQEPGVEGWSLYGRVHGHDRLGEGRMTRTSAVLWLDPEAGLARTVSRWYRLGTPHPSMAAALAPKDDSDQPAAPRL